MEQKKVWSNCVALAQMGAQHRWGGEDGLYLQNQVMLCLSSALVSSGWTPQMSALDQITLAFVLASKPSELWSSLNLATYGDHLIAIKNAGSWAPPGLILILYFCIISALYFKQGHLFQVTPLKCIQTQILRTTVLRRTSGGPLQSTGFCPVSGLCQCPG